MHISEHTHIAVPYETCYDHDMFYNESLEPMLNIGDSKNHVVQADSHENNDWYPEPGVKGYFDKLNTSVRWK